MGKSTFGGTSIKRPFGGNMQPRKAAEPDDPFSTSGRDPMEYERFLRANQTPETTIQKLVNSTMTPQQTATRTAAISSAQNYTADPTGERTQPGQGDVWDGFAKRYVPGERDLLFHNPGIIVRDALSEGKYKGNEQMAGDLQRYADIVFGSGNKPGLYELLVGGNLDPSVMGDDDQINYLVKLIQDQSKVGGQSPTVAGMLNSLFGMMQNENSSLGQDLRMGTNNPAGTEEAISKVLAFIPLLGEFSGNERYANLLRTAASNAADRYMGMQANGKTGGQDFLDFFRHNYLN